MPNRPAPNRPTAQYPTGPNWARQPTAPNPTPGYRDDYGGTYRDDYGDDHRDDYTSGRPRTRGQIFAGVVLVLAAIVSVLLGTQIYQVLASIDPISENPFDGLAGWAMTIGAAGAGAILVFVLAVVALMIARPKVIAGIGLAASLLLPTGAVVLGVLYGGAVLRQNVENDIAADGPAIARDLAANAITQELERRGVEPGPLRDLILGVVGQSG